MCVCAKKREGRQPTHPTYRQIWCSLFDFRIFHSLWTFLRVFFDDPISQWVYWMPLYLSLCVCVLHCGVYDDRKQIGDSFLLLFLFAVFPSATDAEGSPHGGLFSIKTSRDPHLPLNHAQNSHVQTQFTRSKTHSFSLFLSLFHSSLFVPSYLAHYNCRQQWTTTTFRLPLPLLSAKAITVPPRQTQAPCTCLALTLCTRLISTP